MDLQQVKDTRQVILASGGIQPLAWTVLRIHGRDAGNFLHKMTTNDVSKLVIGEFRECFVTDIRGKTLGHGFIVRVAEEGYLFLGSGRQAETLQAHWQQYIISEDVQFDDLEGRMIVLASSMSIGDSSLRVAEGATAEQARDVLFCEVAVKVIPLTVFGPETAILLATPEASQTLLENVARSGATTDAPDVWETLRVETGFPCYGIDVTEDNLPQEVGRNDVAISFTKGCYLGQETVARIDAMGHVNWYLVGVRCPDDIEPRTKLHHDGKVVSRIGSVVNSPRIDGTLALAYVRRGHETPGSRIPTDQGELEVVLCWPLPARY